MGDMEAVALALMEATRRSAMPGEGLGGVRVEEEQEQEQEQEQELELELEQEEQEELTPKN